VVGVVYTLTYVGDSNRVKGTVGSTTTTYLGDYFEWRTLSIWCGTSATTPYESMISPTK